MAASNVPPITPLPNAPLGGQAATPVDSSAGAPNWAHLAIRWSEFFVGGIIMFIGVGALLKRATGIQPTKYAKYVR